MRIVALFAVALAALACSRPALAEARPADLVGTYNGSQMEVGTGLRLEANGRYEYYLSYGALDEMSEGTWAADGDAIVLTSDKYKPPAFELIGSKPGAGPTLDLSLDVPKGLELQYFSALFLRPDHTASEKQFDDGPLHIPLTGVNHPTGFLLGLEVFDVMSEPYDIPPNTRSMHFHFVPNDLGKVAFDHKRLPRDGEAFVLERFGRTLKFRKEKPGTDDGSDEGQGTDEK
ncbi:MAG TPA: hypothetical protein VLM18_09235 [Croceibacterium sp.]|nr:hypothetical protein [Croceibacterium sp.]